MKTTTKTYFALFAACLWLFMIGCYLADKETPKDIDTVACFTMHSEIQRDTVPDNWLIEPRFIDND